MTPGITTRLSNSILLNIEKSSSFQTSKCHYPESHSFADISPHTPTLHSSAPHTLKASLMQERTKRSPCNTFHSAKDTAICITSSRAFWNPALTGFLKKHLWKINRAAAYYAIDKTSLLWPAMPSWGGCLKTAPIQRDIWAIFSASVLLSSHLSRMRRQDWHRSPEGWKKKNEGKKHTPLFKKL